MKKQDLHVLYQWVKADGERAMQEDDLLCPHTVAGGLLMIYQSSTSDFDRKVLACAVYLLTQKKNQPNKLGGDEAGSERAVD